MKYAHTNTAQPIEAEFAHADILWREAVGKGMAGRAAFGVHDTPEAARLSAREGFRKIAAHSKEIYDRDLARFVALGGDNG